MRVFARALALLCQERRTAALLLLGNIIVAGVNIAEPVLFGRIVDALDGHKAALPLVLAWAGIGFFGIFAGVGVAVLADRLAHRRRLAVLADGFAQSIAQPAAFHAGRGSGAVVRSLTAGTDGLFWFWLVLTREHIAAVLGVIALVPTVLVIDARMAGILGALAGLYLLANTLVLRRSTRSQATVEKLHGALAGRVGDVIGNVGVVQSYGRVAAELADFGALTRELLAAQYPVLTWWGLFMVLTRAAGTITMVAVITLGISLARSGEIRIGEIVSFVAFASLLISALQQISTFWVNQTQQRATLAALFELLDAPIALADRPDAQPLPAPVRGEIRFEALSFRYGPGLPGISEIDVTVPAGQTLALVGPTGAGKSTILALLQRMHAPAQGRILIDGQDIATITRDSLSRAIAVVFQEAGLFNRSIAENIAIGRPGASRAEIEAAARAAEADSFIRAKPGGYDFIIGERGQFLSGGERQRLAIARAILKNAPILILDEATSALDTETEARIKTALDRLRQGRTTFIIAHRLSTVASADLIVAIEGGRIVERGRFADLQAGSGLFARLLAAGDFSLPQTEPDSQNA